MRHAVQQVVRHPVHYVLRSGVQKALRLTVKKDPRQHKNPGLDKTAIATLVERTSRYVMLVHLPGAHDAEAVLAGLKATVGTLPEHLQGSLTWDQGSEMAGHKAFTVATGCPVYFCDPASPWQRGSNENTNGLLRQYFPKGSDLSVHSAADLEFVAQQLNGRPRKTLGYRTPAEVFRDLINAS